MDFTPIYNSLFSALGYLIPLVLLAGLVKSSWFKGVFGEFLVNLRLKLFLPKEKYHLIKNITLPTEGGTTQIDHIVVSKYGVFVIETKNMKGWIFGSANQKYWTQKIYRHSSKFQNPIHQNYKHLKTLEDCLSINPESLFSVIVFVGDSTFKTEIPENVTYARGCIRYIKSKKTELLSQQQVEEVISTIESGRLRPSIKTNREHLAHVKEIVKSKQNHKACPKCGSDMVVREAKKGNNKGNKFWGCSSFPQCRAVVKLS